jgi:hypothetical protein
VAIHGPSQHGPLTLHTHVSPEPSDSATRKRFRVALVTCAALPGLDPEDRLLVTALAARGVTAVPAVWDDPGADWDAFDLAVLRSPWDYPGRHDDFVAWTAKVPRLANPADIVGWNTDKTYLRELAAAGIAVTPTAWVPPGTAWPPPTTGEYVVKPTISAGSRDTGRYDLGDEVQRALAHAHVTRLTAAGRTAMVQPYLSAVDTRGETAVVCIPDGSGDLSYSHGIRKGPMLHGADTGDDELYLAEEITARTPTPAELAVARQVLAAVPGGTDRLLYARVDLIPGPDGEPVLIELELTEPSLFLGYAEGAADRLAAAILARLP